MFQKRRFKQALGNFSLFCFLITSLTCPLRAETPPECVFVDSEDVRRNQIATVVAGATVIALVGGVAALAFGGNGHHHHHNHSYSNFSYDSYSTTSSVPYSNTSYSNIPYSNDYYSNHFTYEDYRYSFRDGLEEDLLGDDNIIDNGLVHEEFIEGGQRPVHSHRCKKNYKDTENETKLTVTLSSLPSLQKGGNYNLFVELPSGSTQIIGTLSHTGKSQTLCSGPYTEKGTYHFGVSLRGNSLVSQNTPLAQVRIELNGETVRCETLSSHSKPTFSYTVEK